MSNAARKIVENVNKKRKGDGVPPSNKADIINGAKRNDLSEIEEALENDPKCINQQDKLGRTAAMWAALGGNTYLMEWLSNVEGFDSSILDDAGNSLSCYGARSYNGEAARLAHRLMFPTPK